MASYFLSDAPVHGPGKKQRPISKAFSHLLRHMWASKHCVVDPHRSADLIDVCYARLVLSVCCFPSYCQLTPLMGPEDKNLIDCLID